jgi:sugar phosphate permease
MPSLSEAYDGGEWTGRDPRRVSAGGGLFVVGALAVVTAILALTTGLASVFGATTTVETRRVAGVLAGLGSPAMFLGVVAVLPASRRERLGALVGAALNVAGVGLFRSAYPTRWVEASDSLAFPTAMVYFVGCSVALWFVLSAVASFKLRNNPQGTVRLEVTRQGETEEVHVSRSEYRRYKRAVQGNADNSDAVAEELRALHEDR